MSDDDEWNEYTPTLHEAGLATIELYSNWREISDPVIRPVTLKIGQLSEICERLLMGLQLHGDDFAARRALLSFSKRELIFLILQLSRTDQEAFFPWQLNLKKGPKHHG